MMNNFKSLIENFERLCPSDAKRGYVCQCGTEKMLKRLREPEAMRAFLLVAIFIDQFVYTHYLDVYRQFSDEYRIPKLHAHGSASMASPSWFIYSRHGYDKKVDWSLMSTVADIIWFKTKLFLLKHNNGFDPPEFDKLIKEEIEAIFETDHQALFYQKLNEQYLKASTFVKE